MFCIYHKYFNIYTEPVHASLKVVWFPYEVGQRAQISWIGWCQTSFISSIPPLLRYSLKKNSGIEVPVKGGAW